MKNYHKLLSSALVAFTVFTGIQARADNMASIAIAPLTGVVTLAPRWAIGGSLAGFHFMAQDLSLGGGANQFYSIKGTAIPPGGDIAAFTRYIAASGAATNHVDIGSKLTPNSYSALTSADPDVGYGPVNFYFIHHKSSGDYFTVIVPSSGTASAVTDLKPMSGPGGPATLGASGYFGLTFAAANLGYGLNIFYYLRTDSVTGFTKFGTLAPALLGTSADLFDLGISGYNALEFTGSDVGYGVNKMYYIRLDPITGFTIFGTLNPGTGRVSDIANLGSVYSTLTFVPGDVGFGSGQFYTTGAVNTPWQSVSFAAIADRAMSAGSFTVTPSASSGLPIVLTVASGSVGSATISTPVGGVFTVTPTAPGLIILQASQAGQVSPTPYEFNMLRQSFTAFNTDWKLIGAADFNHDGNQDLIWQDAVNGQRAIWLMNGTIPVGNASLGTVPLEWSIVGAADFNGDGNPDLIWQDTVNGQRAIWLMNGTTPVSSVSLGTVPIEWDIVGTADFNGDGKPDLIWQDTVTGQRAIWLMNGTTPVSSISLGTVPLEWNLVGAADFNGDGKPDLLWQDTVTGQHAIWLMNGTTAVSSVSLGIISTDWNLVGAADFNSDGKPDLIWQDTVNGAHAYWFMNGVIPVSSSN
jgi:hypothetical protein